MNTTKELPINYLPLYRQAFIECVNLADASKIVEQLSNCRGHHFIEPVRTKNTPRHEPCKRFRFSINSGLYYFKVRLLSLQGNAHAQHVLLRANEESLKVTNFTSGRDMPLKIRLLSMKIAGLNSHGAIASLPQKLSQNHREQPDLALLVQSFHDMDSCTPPVLPAAIEQCTHGMLERYQMAVNYMGAVNKLVAQELYLSLLLEPRTFAKVMKDEIRSWQWVNHLPDEILSSRGFLTQQHIDAMVACKHLPHYDKMIDYVFIVRNVNDQAVMENIIHRLDCHRLFHGNGHGMPQTLHEYFKQKLSLESPQDIAQLPYKVLSDMAFHDYLQHYMVDENIAKVKRAKL